MGQLRKFEVVLSDTQIVYFPGQCVNGLVLIELGEDMKVKGITVNCLGKGFIHKKQGKSHLQAEEEYLNTTLLLYGNASDGGGEVTLPTGNHAFPFQFILPVTAPGSYEGTDGCYVRYTLKASISRPWKFKFDKHYKFVFTVGSVLDLNTLPNIDAPAQCTDSKSVCCCCFESDPISATLQLEKTGYVPGEWIVINAEVRDGTGRGTNSTIVRLIMLTEYHFRHNYVVPHERKEIGRLYHGPIEPGGTDVWRGEKLRIPPVPQSFLPGCNLIEIHYILEMVVDVAQSPFDLVTAIAIVIGTIPLRSVVQRRTPQTAGGTITTQPHGTSASADLDLPPPSYRECVFGRANTMEENEEETSGNMNFAPSYTYYDML